MEYFVTFEKAKKLKEKGFNEPCYKYYQKGVLDSDDCWNRYNKGTANRCSAPTISQVLKWLREEKKIHIEPCILADADTDADGKVINEYIYWSFCITSIESGDMIYFEYEHIDDRRFNSFEEAALAGIEYALDNLI